jgi:hypothetical protein
MYQLCINEQNLPDAYAHDKFISYSLTNGKNQMKISNVTKEQSKDTGLAIVLILLLLFYVFNPRALLIASMVVLVIVMVNPWVFKFPAVIWFGFSHILGNITSKIILTVIFFGIVTPVGLLRRLSGKDSMKLKLWKKNRSSVFTDRDYLFVKNDFNNPF